MWFQVIPSSGIVASGWSGISPRPPKVKSTTYPATAIAAKKVISKKTAMRAP